VCVGQVATISPFVPVALRVWKALKEVFDVEGAVSLSLAKGYTSLCRTWLFDSASESTSLVSLLYVNVHNIHVSKMEMVSRATDVLRHFRETKMSTLKAPQEFVGGFRTKS
jgi:hypothetical protein